MQSWTRPQLLVALLLVAVVLAAILFDIIILWRGGESETVSSSLLTWARRNPLLPFLFGVLIGHLFWPQ